MKRIILSLIFSTGFGLQVHAQQAEIKSVINDQLLAFQADDFASAFTHASPVLKKLFQNPTRFERMVTTGYPMVHRPGSINFKQMQERDGTYYQYVFIEDKAGVGYIAEYAMIKTAQGWKINGVNIKESNDIGT